MPKATKRERQRQNRDARRQAMQAEEKRRRRFKSIRLFVIILVAAVAFAFLYSITRDDGGDDSENAADTSSISCTNRKPENPPTTEQFPAAPTMTIDTSATYTVTLDTSCGEIPITLDAAASPETVNNFVFLAQQGFYDGTTFHRVVKGFVDQGGDPAGTGNGGPGYDLPDELPTTGYEPGDVAMARGDAVSGSQFFLVIDADGTPINTPPFQYNKLGTMSTQGLKVAKKINSFAQPDETPSRTIYVFTAKVSGPTASSSTTTTAAP